MSITKRQFEKTKDFELQNEPESYNHEFELDRLAFMQGSLHINENLKKAEKNLEDSRNILKDVFDRFGLEWED